MELQSQVRVYNETLGIKGAKGRLLQIHKTGYYEIALDYYKGDNPEVAVVQIDAGLVSRTFTISMGSDLYGTQISPVSAATIFAHKNPDSGYDFFVYH